VVGIHCDLGSDSGSNGFAVQKDEIKFWDGARSPAVGW